MSRRLNLKNKLPIPFVFCYKKDQRRSTYFGEYKPIFRTYNNKLLYYKRVTNENQLMVSGLPRFENHEI
jgi:hypothetical protein